MQQQQWFARAAGDEIDFNVARIDALFFKAVKNLLFLPESAAGFEKLYHSTV
ncbi:MAG: hypothetical protein O3B08_01485 [Proteobacteria bacterium]|nr:hypothetical protein [Pseudomonadota bacterium]